MKHKAQKLIDAQLTPREIDWIVGCLNESLLCLEKGFIRSFLENIIVKLNEQKNMWEVE